MAEHDNRREREKRERKAESDRTRENKALALYIETALTRLPTKTSEEYLYTHTAVLSVDHHRIESLAFFTLSSPRNLSMSGNKGFGIHIAFRSVPENVIRYKDGWDETHHVKRIRSTYRFSDTGDKSFAHTMPEIAAEQDDYGDLFRDDRARMEVPTDLLDKEIAKRITIIPGKPGPKEAPGGWRNLLDDAAWYEEIFSALTVLHSQYPEQVPNFQAFMEAYMKANPSKDDKDAV